MEHYRETTRHGPEQLQHRDVEREAGHRQPGPRWAVRNTIIHPREEVRHVAVFHHHALGPAGGPGCIDDIAQVAGGHAAVQIVLGLPLHAPPVAVDAHDLRVMRREPVEQALLRQENRALSVFDHQRQAVRGVRWIERNIGRPCLENPVNARQQVDGSF